ncbi:MAG: hypothetical protein ACRD2P_00235, partial [Terriglobia bacterium]
AVKSLCDNCGCSGGQRPPLQLDGAPATPEGLNGRLPAFQGGFPETGAPKIRIWDEGLLTDIP